MVISSHHPVDAFVACGGKTDKSGFVRKETLVKIIKGDFGLTINIEVHFFAFHVCRQACRTTPSFVSVCDGNECSLPVVRALLLL